MVSALDPHLIERFLMGRIGEGVPCGKDPGVPAAGPAAAEFNCGELGLRCPDLYSPADQAGIERVVVSIKTQIWLWGDPDHPTLIGARQILWQLTHFGLLFLEMLADDPFGGAVFSIVCLGQPSIKLVLEIKRVGEAPASLEVAVEEAVASLKSSFGLRVAGLKDDPAKVQLAEVCAKLSVGRPPPLWRAPSRSTTAFSGRAPSWVRHRLMPQLMSSKRLEKIRAAASIFEYGSSEVSR